MKKIILILSILLLSGCADYIEINDLAIITGLIIDYKEDNYILTSQIIESNDESKIKVITTKGSTIEEALAKVSETSNKEVFISHLKTIILTEDIVKDNIDVYDFFLRDAKSKMNFNMYIADKESSDKILKIYEDVDGSAIYIENLIKYNNKIFSSSTPLVFTDLVYKKLEYGLDPIYPNVSIQKNNDEEILYLDKLVTFNEDKEKLTLNDIETISYNMLTNNLEKTFMDIDCDDKTFSLSLENAKTKFKWKENIFYTETSIKGKLNSYECDYDLNDTKNINKLNTLAEKYIEKEISKLIEISKNNKVDFIGIGNYIYKHDKNYFDFKNNNWNNNLKNINTKVNVDIKITSIGEIR